MNSHPLSSHSQSRHESISFCSQSQSLFQKLPRTEASVEVTSRTQIRRQTAGGTELPLLWRGRRTLSFHSDAHVYICIFDRSLTRLFVISKTEVNNRRVNCITIRGAPLCYTGAHFRHVQMTSGPLSVRRQAPLCCEMNTQYM